MKTTEFALPPLRDPADPATWRTARHEAGHAVVAVVYGIEFNHVTLRPRNPRYRGAVIGLRTRGRPLPALAVFTAGCIAAYAANPTGDLHNMLCTNGRYDLEGITRIGDGLPPDSLGQIAARAVRICTDTHAEAVAAVADALVAHPDQRLSYRAVADLVEDHSPGGLTWLIRRMTETLNREQDPQ